MFKALSAPQTTCLVRLYGLTASYWLKSDDLIGKGTQAFTTEYRAKELWQKFGHCDLNMPNWFPQNQAGSQEKYSDNMPNSHRYALMGCIVSFNTGFQLCLAGFVTQKDHIPWINIRSEALSFTGLHISQWTQEYVTDDGMAVHSIAQDWWQLAIEETILMSMKCQKSVSETSDLIKIRFLIWPN